MMDTILQDTLSKSMCSSKDCAVFSIAEIIALLGDPESVAVTGEDRLVKKRYTSADI
jgi:hypothetical protein